MINKQESSGNSLNRVEDKENPINPKESLQRDHLSTSPDLKQVFDFTVDIIDKQYRSYLWNDGKVQALVTIDTALIAGILLILQTYKSVSLLALILLGISFIVLLSSFLICLVHAIPRMNSGIGNENNLRTMVGITQYEKEEYHRQIISSDLSNMVRMNCNQISGMCKNNLRSHSLIRAGVQLTIAGVIIIGIALPIIILPGWHNANTSPIPPKSIKSQPAGQVSTGSVSAITSARLQKSGAVSR